MSRDSGDANNSVSEPLIHNNPFPSSPLSPTSIYCAKAADNDALFHPHPKSSEIPLLKVFELMIARFINVNCWDSNVIVVRIETLARDSIQPSI